MRSTGWYFGICMLSVLMLACGGGGGGSNGGTNTPPGVTQPNTPPPPPTFTLNQTALSGTKDVDFDSDFIVSGPQQQLVLPFTWTVTGLPEGLLFSVNSNTSHMRIFGRPKVSGTFPVHVVVRDSSAGQPVRVDATVTISLDTAFKFSNSFIPPAVVGLPYSHQIAVANGVAPLTYQITFGTMSPGLTFNTTTGVLSGVATMPRPYSNVGMRVTDSSNPPRSIEATLMGLEVVTPLAFSGQTITIFRGASNFPSVNFTGGVPFIVATLAGGSFPPGVSIDNSSNYPRFSGAPTQIGQWTANIKITDSYSPPETVTGTIKFYVNGPPPQITADFPHGVVGVPYSYSLSAVNGTRPFQWQVTGLPAGLSADANGNITGTPTTTGIFQNVTIKLTDSSQPTAAVVTSSGVIRVKAFSGRNDSPATATAATTGIYDASLSPYADAAGIEQPDHDYFRVTVAPGTILQLTVDPRYPSQVDPLTELVDVNGARISNCKVPGSTSFASPCLSDDFDPGVNHSSHLEWQNNSGADQTLYIHVLEWSGDARPDFKYRLTINGAK